MTMRPRSFDDDAATETAVSDLLRRQRALEEPAVATTTGSIVTSAGSTEPAFLVAAADSAPETISAAHFRCSGSNDDIQIVQALNALPDPTPVGGKSAGPRGTVRMSEGTFDCDGDITLPGGTALLGRGKGTLIHGGDLRFLMNEECELGNFAYTESTARAGAQSVIGASGSPNEMLIHDIYVFGMLSPTDHFIEFPGGGSGGRIWNIHQEVGIGVCCRIDGEFFVYDNKFADGSTGVIAENGDVYIWDNEFDGVTTGIQISSSFADVMIGPNVYRGVTTPFVDADTDVVSTRFTDTQEVWWSYPGLAVASTTGVERKYFGERAFIQSVSVAADTAGTGTGLNTIDVHKNGTTIFTDQNDRPTLAAAENYSGAAGPAVRGMAAGDFLTVDIDAVTASTAAEDITIVVRYVELADL